MPLDRPATGIGPALRRARLRRGKSLEEASRETRIRAEYLRALEGDAFDVLQGDVYVRGFLRSYSSYLGLDPDKVVSAYARHSGPTPPPPEPALLQGRPATPRALGSWPVAGAVAISVLVAAAAFGLLSRSAWLPEPASPASVPPSVEVLPPTVTAALVALEEVGAEVLADGAVAFSGTLEKGEALSFEAKGTLRIELEQGGYVRLTVNGTDLGIVGDPGVPYVSTFDPDDHREEPSRRGG